MTTIIEAAPQAQLLGLLARLVPLHGLEARRDEILDCFSVLTALSLRSYPATGELRQSTLTSDGMPFEMSVALSPSGCGGLRYAVEAGDLNLSFEERLAAGSAAVSGVMTRIGVSPLYGMHDMLMERIFPREVRGSSRYKFGLWLGLMHRPGTGDVLKVYYNLAPWRNNIEVAVASVSAVLDGHLDGRALREIALHLPAALDGAFLGLEYAASGLVKAKVYFRNSRVLPQQSLHEILALLGLDGQGEILDDFHAALAGRQSEYPERSLMLALGVDERRQSGLLNVYYALNRFGKDDKEAETSNLALLSRTQVDPMLYKATLHTVSRSDLKAGYLHYHTMTGICLSRREVKVNIYMKPPWEGLCYAGAS